MLLNFVTKSENYLQELSLLKSSIEDEEKHNSYLNSLDKEAKEKEETIDDMFKVGKELGIY